MTDSATVRAASERDLPDIMRIHKAAFGDEAVDALVSDLLQDPSARPTLSLIALAGGRPVGHVLFTKLRLAGSEQDNAVSLSILAPLAVVPEAQNKGVGRQLIEAGLAKLQEAGVDLVLVLGHPDYYPRHGFAPAGVLGLEAPYPIPENKAGAWMVRALRPGVLGRVRGRVLCADALDKPELWRE
ncbi:MAG: N-acetyltransferase [Alphaproteobacteria bacterium]|nr:N-acetyltransferase [Alphaproteobacteria bacterium]